jgi:hypothetical protein
VLDLKDLIIKETNDEIKRYAMYIYCVKPVYRCGGKVKITMELHAVRAKKNDPKCVHKTKPTEILNINLKPDKDYPACCRGKETFELAAGAEHKIENISNCNMVYFFIYFAI